MFTFGQLRQTFARLVEFGHSGAAFPVALQRVLNAIEQRLIVERLFDEIDGAALARPHRHRYVAVAGDEDDGHLLMAGLFTLSSMQPGVSSLIVESNSCADSLVSTELPTDSISQRRDSRTALS